MAQPGRFTLPPRLQLADVAAVRATIVARANALGGRARAAWAGFGLIQRGVALGLGAGLLLALGSLVVGGRGTVGLGAEGEAVPVVLGTVAKDPLPVYLDGIGTVQASNTVQVRARIDGEIIEIGFKEGQAVKAGDILVRIDPRPFEANWKQMQANLARDQSQLSDARANLTRLIGIGEFAAKKQVDGQRALVAQMEALVAADQAQVDYAKAQLDYTVIRSPFDGRTGLRQVDIGNIVHAGDQTPLVTVTQVDPIAVLFTLNADDLPMIVDGMKAGTLAVYAFAKDNKTKLAEGNLDLVDNQIDQATGTVKLKATFPNPDSRLWPGQFVNARLRVTLYDGLSVSANAIQQGPNGAYLWIVDGEGKASMRSVVVTRLQDGRALIDSSLTPGQKVVVDGQYKLQPGAATVPAPPQPEAPVAGSTAAGS